MLDKQFKYFVIGLLSISILYVFPILEFFPDEELHIAIVKCTMMLLLGAMGLLALTMLVIVIGLIGKVIHYGALLIYTKGKKVFDYHYNTPQ